MDIINTWGRYSESFYLYLLAVFFDFGWVKSIIDSFKSSWKVGTWTSYWLLKNSTYYQIDYLLNVLLAETVFWTLKTLTNAYSIFSRMYKYFDDGDDVPMYLLCISKYI